jgi:hypothetical protein
MISFSLKQSALILFMIVFTSGTSFGQIVRSSPKIKKIIHKNCSLSDTCDLKTFELKVNEYKISINDPQGPLDQFGTTMVANYETSSKKSLEKYGIVQFMQGCQ